MNQVNETTLNAEITRLSPLRYTPAGVPVAEMYLKHHSLLTEANAQRQVNLSIKAIAMGLVAERLSTQNLGTCLLFKGFLHSPKENQVVFHIQTVDSL